MSAGCPRVVALVPGGVTVRSAVGGAALLVLVGGPAVAPAQEPVVGAEPAVAPVTVRAGTPDATFAAVPAATPVTVEQPARAFARTIGDVLVQRIAIADGGDGDAMVDALPAGRIGAWLERLPAHVEETPDGRHVLELRYQVVNAPSEPLTIRLPPLALGDGAVEVPEWPIGLVPLTPRELVGEGDLLALRPDRRLPPFDTGARRARLAATAWALAATALAWLGWWALRRRADRVRLPFARALHEMRRVPAAGRDEAEETWTALHRALDDTAGGTVHRASLERLLAAAPWLVPSRDAIERFYAASAARFFSRPPRTEPFPVAELGRTLYRAEKRNAG